MNIEKLIVFSAPSGSGKTTLVNYLMGCKELNLAFSISATSRAPREHEIDGKHYYFLSVESFKDHIKKDDFLEYEEVYPNHFYGTLRSEVKQIWKQGKHVVFDIDVVGGLRIKSLFPSQTLSIFIKPPSIEELKKRLQNRNTDTYEKIEMRIKKAEKEILRAAEFDIIIENTLLETAKKQAYQAVLNFLGK